MTVRTSLAILAPVLAAAALGACAVDRPAPQPPETREAPPTSRDDPAARLVRSLDALKQPSDRAQKDTNEARSVLEAIGGAPERQGDAGPADH